VLLQKHSGLGLSGRRFCDEGAGQHDPHREGDLRHGEILNAEGEARQAKAGRTEGVDSLVRSLLNGGNKLRSWQLPAHCEPKWNIDWRPQYHPPNPPRIDVVMNDGN
jgi:hypothetical protein